MMLMMGSGSVSASVLFDTITGVSQVGLNDIEFVDGGSPLGNSFYVNGSGQVETVSFSLGAKTPTSGGSVLVFIVPDVNGLPAHSGSTTNLVGATLLGTIFDSSLLQVGSGNTPLPTTTITTDFAVNAGTYWIELVDGADRGNGGLDTQSTSAVWGYNIDGRGIGTSGQYYSTNSGGTLTATSDLLGPFRMAITGTIESVAVPEPSSLLILCFSIWGLWLFSHQRGVGASVGPQSSPHFG